MSIHILDPTEFDAVAVLRRTESGESYVHQSLSCRMSRLEIATELRRLARWLEADL